MKDDTPRRPPEELLYDSEATLRLVDQAIEELSVLETDRERPQQPGDPPKPRMNTD